jgi:hypothetical protein
VLAAAEGEGFAIAGFAGRVARFAFCADFAPIREESFGRFAALRAG